MKNISIIQIFIALTLIYILFKNEIFILIKKIKSYVSQKKNTSNINKFK